MKKILFVSLRALESLALAPMVVVAAVGAATLFAAMFVSTPFLLILAGVQHRLGNESIFDWLDRDEEGGKSPHCVRPIATNRQSSLD